MNATRTATPRRLLTVALAGSLIAAPFLSAGSAHAASAYTVKDSDTLWKISVNQGVTLTSLINANPQIKNPNIIWGGMTITIPSKATTPSAPATKPSTPTTTKPSTPTTSTPATDTATQYAQQVATIVNQERAAAGLSPLTFDSALSKMAVDKAKDMIVNNYFDHTSPTYGSPFDMMTAYGIPHSYAGENIAKGQRTPQEVMTAWMNSAGHKANILKTNYKKIGVGYYNGAWVQEFTD
ncbi:CAP domain-containing protein [Gorillibacterium sp. sgz500922]|uniref:CAP domain-containing protein n=1 Tax=Gorillibacterium sp. sgz500922 TaxID=3446694 RepID=UPI003F67F987